MQMPREILSPPPSQSRPRSWMSSKVFRSLTREDEKHGGRVELCALKKARMEEI